MGDIYITTLSNNPAVHYLGTTWEKIEGKFLLSTSGNGASGQTGGSNTKTITQANLPNVKLQVATFSLGRGNQEIVGDAKYQLDNKTVQSGAFYMSTDNSAVISGASSTSGKYIKFQASRSWTGMSTSASPFTTPLGSGIALDITPAYYTVHIWKRLT